MGELRPGWRCKGDWGLGNACGKCTHCKDTCHLACVEIKRLNALVAGLEAQLRFKDATALEEACKAFNEEIGKVCSNIAAIGAEAGKIILYLVAKTGAVYPATFRGFPVETRVSGKLIIGRPG